MTYRVSFFFSRLFMPYLVAFLLFNQNVATLPQSACRKFGKVESDVIHQPLPTCFLTLKESQSPGCTFMKIG